MGDLNSRFLILLKGLLFLGIALICAALLIAQSPEFKTILLVALLVWSASRFYYFLFYVLEKYVDPTMRYAGLLDLLLGMRQRRRAAWRQSQDSLAECASQGVPRGTGSVTSL